MNKTLLKKLVALLLGGGLLVVIDQITKMIARNSLALKEKVLIDNVLEFKLLHNTGAAWGSFSGKTLILGIVSIIFTLLILYAYFKIDVSKRNMPLIVIFILIIAGAIGNMIDRFALHYVTDFIYFKLINFPIFNVADIYVTCSTILMAILVLFYYKDEDFEWLKIKKK